MQFPLASLLFVVFITLFVAWSSSKKDGFFSKFYKWVPSILLLYLLPALAVNSGMLTPGAEVRLLAMDTALPLCLIILTAIINIPELLRISRPGLLAFLAGTVGIVIGGPLALRIVGIFLPDLLSNQGADSVWKGLICITGGWINGTPGQLSMKEVYGASEEVFLTALAADIILQNAWLIFLLYSVRFQNKINKVFLGTSSVDTNLIDDAELQSENLHALKWPTWKPWLLVALTMALVLFLSPRLANIFDNLTGQDPGNAWNFLGKQSLWLVLLSTTAGILISLTGIFQRHLRFWTALGNGLLLFVIASIGMQLDLHAVNFQPSFLLIGIVWLLIHLALLFAAIRLFKAPWHFAAIGSQANIGGPASASVVASAFHPSLVSLGVLLGVLSNVIGNYANLVAGMLFQWVAQ